MATLGSLALVLLSLSATTVPTPSFDCTRASGTVERLICQDAELATLDRELDAVWQQALAALPDAAQAKAYQRGWVKGRDECWKADVVRDCVQDEYERRITELQIQAGLVEVPDAVHYTCADGRLVWLATFDNTRLPAAVLTAGDDQVILFQTDSGDRRYLGRNATLRQSEDRVELEWLGKATSCNAGPGRDGAAVSVVDPCDGLPTDASFVVATSPTAGAVVRSPFEVIGCSRTFESTLTWRLLARDGQVVAEGHSRGGGVDGPGVFRFTLDAGGAAGLHHLEVDEPRITDEGFPPGRTVLPLVLVR